MRVFASNARVLRRRRSCAVRWVEPLHVCYRGYDVYEIPPNGHGIVALMALNILKNFDLTERDSAETFHAQIESIKCAFADGMKYIAIRFA